MKLNGRTALVTGAGGGIGRAIALRLAADGATVAVTDLTLERAEKVADEICRKNGRAAGFKMDVMNSAEVRKTIGNVLQKFERIDILVNNAGGSAGLLNKLSQFKDTTEEIWRWVIDLNLNGTLSCIHAVLPSMTEKRNGKIINIASIAGEVGIPERTDYSAAKAGIIAATKVLAMELGKYGINVNCISPGAIESRPCNLAHGTYLGRTGTPDEIASMTAFLASEEASFITGVNYIVDGGRVLGPTGR